MHFTKMPTRYLPSVFAAAMASAPVVHAEEPIAPPTQLDATGLRLSHFMLSVSDLDRSLAFYKALGFEVTGTRPIPARLAPVIGMPTDFVAKLAFMRRDGLVFELVQFDKPRIAAAPSSGIGAQLGIGNFALRVDSVARVVRLITANGGTCFPSTNLKLPSAELMFCSDPDGIRIELSYLDPAAAAQTQAPPAKN